MNDPNYPRTLFFTIQELNQIDFDEKAELKKLLLTSEYRNILSCVEQIKFILKSFPAMNMKNVFKLFHISSKTFYKYNKECSDDSNSNESSPTSSPTSSPNIKNKIFLESEEKLILNKIFNSQEKMNCLTSKEIRHIAENIYQNRKGVYKKLNRDWWNRFSLKYKDILTVKPVSVLEDARRLVSKQLVNNYFDSLKNAFQNGIDPSLVINMDETGCGARPDKGRKVSCVIHSESSKLPFRRDLKEYRHISIVTAITLSGELLIPVAVSSRKNVDKELDDQWYNCEFIHAYSKKGYLNEKVMIQWIETSLLNHINSKREILNNPNAPAVLIMDQLSAHYTSSVQEALNKIKDLRIVFLPAHSSHILQPLDVSLFGVFKTRYSALKNEDNVKSYANKIKLIHQALYHATYQGNVIGSWKRVGLFFNYSNYQMSKACINDEVFSSLLENFSEL